MDVFAYGMTLYELLSFRSPFDNVPLHKRNFEIHEKQRPAIQARETRSLVLFIDLMAMCWNQEPEDRPNMSQVRKWIESPEFEKLRTEVDLQYVKSISCACVCRILPQNEEQYVATSIHTTSAPDGKSVFLSSSEDNVYIETDQGERIQDDDVYQFVDPQGGSGGHGSSMAGTTEGAIENVQLQQHNFDPYTQIWLCGKSGLLQIFTYVYNDDNVGQYVSNIGQLLLLL